MRPRTLDGVLTAAVFVTSVSESLISAGVSGPRWAAALLSGAMSLLLLGRRTHPVAMSAALLVLVLPTAAFVVNPSDLISTFFPLLILAYSGGAYASPRGSGVVLGGLIAGVVAIGLLDPDSMSADLYFPVIIVVLCWLGGRTGRTRARHAGELHETAALAAERREREAQEAVGEERRRIAREMHDVVAHSISVMVVQAGGARRILASDPVRAEQAASRIRATGSDALAEMHILRGVLESAPDGASRRRSTDWRSWLRAPAPPACRSRSRSAGSVIGARPGEVAALLAKLGVRERVQAVVLAHQARMVD